MKRAVIGYEGLYWIDEEGNVFNKKGHKRKTSLNRQGYPYIILCKGGKITTITIHRLVALNFLGVPPDGYEVNHKDFNKLNNSVGNLEWVKRQDNIRHSYTNGKRRYVPVDVFTQSGECVARFESIASAAKAFGISAGRVGDCVRGLTKSSHGYVWKRSEV